MWDLTVQDDHDFYVLPAQHAGSGDAYHVVATGMVPVLAHNCNTESWEPHYEKAGDLPGKYTPGQATRDPSSQWYHEMLSNHDLLSSINDAEEGEGIAVSRAGRILGGRHRLDELLVRVGDGRIDPNTPIRIDVPWRLDLVSTIRPTDPDFRICLIGFEELLEIQAEAESRRWGTRWTSEAALRNQVREGPVVLRSFMREERENAVRAYRCILLFAVANKSGVGATATIDVVPERLISLGRIDRDPDVREALTLMFSLAINEISMITKEL